MELLAKNKLDDRLIDLVETDLKAAKGRKCCRVTDEKGHLKQYTFNAEEVKVCRCLNSSHVIAIV